jgi:hypothetical protein
LFDKGGATTVGRSATFTVGTGTGPEEALSVTCRNASQLARKITIKTAATIIILFIYY